MPEDPGLTDGGVLRAEGEREAPNENIYSFDPVDGLYRAKGVLSWQSVTQAKQLQRERLPALTNVELNWYWIGFFIYVFDNWELTFLSTEFTFLKTVQTVLFADTQLNTEVILIPQMY